MLHFLQMMQSCKVSNTVEEEAPFTSVQDTLNDMQVITDGGKKRRIHPLSLLRFHHENHELNLNFCL